MRNLHAVKSSSNVTEKELANMYWHYQTRGYLTFKIYPSGRMVMFNGLGSKAAHEGENCTLDHTMDIKLLDKIDIPQNFLSKVTIERV